MANSKGGNEAAARQAMRRILYAGILELRAEAFQTGRAMAAGEGQTDAHVKTLREMEMIADTLHHIPSYLDHTKLRAERRPGLAAPPRNQRQPAVSWFASLWQVRSEQQEAWLLDVLAYEHLTPLGILGMRNLGVIERNRETLLERMSQSEAEALAGLVRLETDYMADVGERDGDFVVWVKGTPEGSVPLWSESAWHYWRRELPSTPWRLRRHSSS